MANFSIPVKKKSPLIPILIIVGVLALGGGGYFYWQGTDRDNPNQQQPGEADEGASELSFTDRLNGLMGENKYDEALELVEKQDDAESDPQLLMIKADILSKKGSAREARELLEKAEGDYSNQSYEFKRAKARILASEGDRAGAIALYEEAIALGEKATPTDNEIERFEHNNMIADYRWELEQLRRGN